MKFEKNGWGRGREEKEKQVAHKNCNFPFQIDDWRVPCFTTASFLLKVFSLLPPSPSTSVSLSPPPPPLSLIHSLFLRFAETFTICLHSVSRPESIRFIQSDAFSINSKRKYSEKEVNYLNSFLFLSSLSSPPLTLSCLLAFSTF